MKKYLDITNIFWSFIRSINNTPMNILNKTDIYKSIHLYNMDHMYKINMNVLYDVNMYNYDILSECKADIDNDYLIFDSFMDLLNGINELYKYQNESEYKDIIYNGVNTINSIINKNENTELCNMINSLSI